MNIECQLQDKNFVPLTGSRLKIMNIMDLLHVICPKKVEFGL